MPGDGPVRKKNTLTGQKGRNLLNGLRVQEPRVRLDFLVFQLPCVRVGNEDGPKPRCESRQNIGARAVADHAGGVFVERVAEHQFPVGSGIFFFDDCHKVKAALQAGAVQFA